MEKIYGKEYFVATWNAWIDAMLTIYNDQKGIYFNYVPIVLTAFITKTSILGNICDDKLSQIICPTLIIHGMKDYMVEEGHAHNLNEKIAKSQ